MSTRGRPCLRPRLPPAFASLTPRCSSSEPLLPRLRPAFSLASPEPPSHPRAWHAARQRLSVSPPDGSAGRGGPAAAPCASGTLRLVSSCGVPGGPADPSVSCTPWSRLHPLPPPARPLSPGRLWYKPGRGASRAWSG
eukprot:3687341-Pleurochrysis_carterae.AAC.1